MDKNRKFKSLCGEITVFLSMVFFLVLSLIGTMLEAARLNVGESYGDRSLQSAMDSLFTEYCLPVWEDYHVFVLEGEGGEEADKTAIQNTLREYMEATLNSSGEEQGLGSIDTMDLLSMGINQLEIKELKRIGDEKGENFFQQVVEYSKYRAGKDFIVSEREAIGSLGEVAASVRVAEQQLETERKMAEVNIDVLAFLSSVEGISVGKTGISYRKNGLLKTEKYFVKKFCTTFPTMQSVGIGHEKVWKSLKSSYSNPITMIEKIEKEVEEAIERRKREEEAAGEEIELLEGEGQSESSFKRLERLEKDLICQTEGILEQILKAQKLLRKVEKERAIFAEEVGKFEAVYEREKSALSEEMKKAFGEEIKKLKVFAGVESQEATSAIAGILAMEVYLEKDRELLERLLDISSVSIGSSFQEAEWYKEQLEAIRGDIRGYCTRQMKFDYSSLIIEGEVENPVQLFAKGYEKGLLELVLKEPSRVSKKVKEDGGKGQGEVFQENFLDSLKESATNGYQQEVGEGMGSFCKEFDGENWLGKEVEKKLEEILFSLYIREHFQSFEEGKDFEKQEEEAAKEKDTMLNYEQEYIMAGNGSDRKNLSATVSKMVFTRSILNYIYLLTDKEKTDAAYTTAMALVGYSGMEPLVQLTKNLILLAWATEESIVDAAAMVQEKEIPLFKTKESFQITYKDLLAFGRPLVQEKVQKITDKGTGLTIGYEGYLRLFLAFVEKEEKLERVMELVERNIQLRYGEDFALGLCICQVEAEAEYFLEEKFLRLPFVKQLLPDREGGFAISSNKSCSY